MAERSVVSTSGALAAIGPYSQAIRTGGLLFLSGQIPLDPATGQLVPGGIAEQTEVYGRHFPVDPPARKTVQVARLPKDALVEVSAICVVGG